MILCLFNLINKILKDLKFLEFLFVGQPIEEESVELHVNNKL